MFLAGVLLPNFLSRVWDVAWWALHKLWHVVWWHLCYAFKSITALLSSHGLLLLLHFTVRLTLSLPAFFTLPAPLAFFKLFTKFSWTPEYFVVWISEHAICQKKVSALKKIFFFLEKTTSAWDSERSSKRRWRRSLPSTLPKLAHSYTTFWLMLGRFDVYAV